MTEPNDSATPPKVAARSSHNLSWIAMVVMAGMCLLMLVWATTLNVG